MSTFQRFDRAGLGRAYKTDSGSLRAPAKLTRIGVFNYMGSDGKQVRELRLPEEVFSADSLASFSLVPLTDDHPYAQGGVVNSDNFKALQVGTVGAPRVEGEYVEADIVVNDASVVDKILSGKAQELSCGYFCDREVAPEGAKWKAPNGREYPYDFIQRNIRGNHVAVVAKGRAGPEVRVQLDSATAIQVDADEPVKEETPKMNEQELAALKLALDQATARADSADAKIKSLEVELTKANDPARITEAVKTRVALETKARGAVKELNTDGLSDVEVKRAVVAKLNESVKLDGKSDEYVSACFELLTAGALVSKNPVTEAIAKAVEGEKTTEVKTDGRNHVEVHNEWFFSHKHNPF